MKLSFEKTELDGLPAWFSPDLPEVSLFKVAFGYKPWRFHVSSDACPLAFLRVREFACRADAEACLLKEAKRLG